MERLAPKARKAPNALPALAGGAIVLAALAAYHGSFSGPLVALDVPAIVDNPSIRHLGSLGRVLSPPSDGGLTVGGRPVLNLTLAINYALGGTKVWGYHAVNLLIHILAGLTLFGIVRRTLERVGTGGPPVRGGLEGPAEVADGRAARPYLSTLLAFASALIWTVHPLQTESVTYVIQRAESLMGLLYLLTLYCFIRYVEGGSSFAKATEDEKAGRSIWAWLSVGACFFGMGTKEVMVSAPVIVLLYDRTFVSGTWREAWRRRRGLYSGLAGTWLLLGWLVAGTGGSRGGTSGFGLGVSWWSYALTQFPAVVRYLRLALWPHPLDFHYGAQWVTVPTSIIPDALVVVALVVAVGWGLLGPVVPQSETEGDVLLRSAKRSYGGQALGFAGAWFFAILAPTSFVPGVTQTMAEHRMYLALAPVVTVAMCGLYFLIEWIFQRVGTGGPPVRSLCATLGPAADGRAARPYLGLCLVLAAGLGCLTARRNRVYRSELALWSDTAVKSPDNPYAHNNLGISLAGAGRTEEAGLHFTRALQLNPDYAEAHNNLGLALADTGRLPEAIGHYEQALRLRPNYPEAETNLGVALADAGRMSEAIFHFQRAVRLDADYPPAHNNLAVALAGSGRLEEAMAQYGQVLRLRPDYAEAHYNLGNALLQTGRLAEAIAHYTAALRLKPDYAEAHANLGVALAEAGRPVEAMAQDEEALRLSPNDPDVRHNLELARQAAAGGSH